MVDNPENPDDIRQEMEDGEREMNVYSEEGREELVESGEIEPWEEGFAMGAEEGEAAAKCSHCHKVLSDDPDEIVERIYDDVPHRFCSEECAKAGPDE